MTAAMLASRLGGGRLAVDELLAHGVETVFGIPASHVIELYDALSQTPQIRTVVARNEQTAAYMADGYARRTLRPGIVVPTGGPGLGNVITGLQIAWADSSPLVVITSDLGPKERARAPLGIPHETFDSAALAAATGATVTRADTPHDVPGALVEAIAATTRGRRRPSVCLLSRDALEGTADTAILRPGEAQTSSQVNQSHIDAILRELERATHPLIYVGAGVVSSQAEPLLAELIARTGIPCLTTALGRSAFDDRNAGWAGVVTDEAAASWLEAADVVLALGTSFGWESTRNWTKRPRGILLHVDVDPEELGKHFEPTVAVAADVRTFLTHLLRSPDLDRVRSADTLERTPVAEHPWMAALDRALPPSQLTVACDVTMAMGWVTRGIHFSPDRRLLMPWNSMAMGWAYAAALGAQAASDDAVVAVMGDGGALFTVGELATAVEEQLPVCLVVFNNHLYGTIAQLQDVVCERRRFGVELREPDFPAVARAFGMTAARATTPDELEAAVTAWLEQRTPTLIEATVDFAALS